MRTYQVSVTRDGKWWMIAVPELDGYVTPRGTINSSDTTQARRLSVIPARPAIDHRLNRTCIVGLKSRF